MSLHQATSVQHLALVPTQHVWIAANAGTGKTEVLVRRLLTLLITDPTLSPADILALTFTNAGAAEMQLRLAQVLHSWVAQNDEQLTTTISTQLALTLTPAQRQRLRSLPQLITAHPPLITTIHGFGQRLISRFGAQVGLPAGAPLATQAQQEQLLQQAQRNALAEALEDDTAGTLTAVHTLLESMGEGNWRTLTAALVTQWPQLTLVQQRAGGWQALLTQLKTDLGLPTDTTTLPPLAWSNPAWQALHTFAALGSTKAIAALQSANSWQDFFFTKDGLRKQLIEAAYVKKAPADYQLLLDEQHRLADLQNQHAGARTISLTTALAVWSHAVQTHYTQVKHQAGVLDFADLLNGLEALLTQSQTLAQSSDDATTANPLGSMVWEGLDRTLRHLLVDEAQDNNPQQARIVQLLVRELLSGQSHHSTPRTVLAVGDMKQSIFRFQGAQPPYFLELEKTLSTYGGAGLTAVMSLQHSFRSSPAILQVVDSTFADPDLAAAVLGDPTTPWPTHQSVHADRAGVVELWPLITEEQPPETAPWRLPMDQTYRTDGEVLAAHQLAARLKDMMAAGTLMPSTGQPLQWADVMVLTQRNGIAAVVAGILQQHGIPTTTQAKHLTPQVVSDLTALMRFMVDETDNHALAHVAKSPIGNLSDAHLLQLHQATSKDTPAWAPHLPQVAPQLHAQLTAWRAASHVTTPCGWLHLVATQAGLTDAAAIDGLRAMATTAPTLTHLLAMLQMEDAPQPLATGTNAVQVSTVHGAKGLGAPLVVLIDTTAPLVRPSTDLIVWQQDSQGLPRSVMVRQNTGYQPSLQTDWQAAEKRRLRADNLRLLYVALTRAKDMLWVIGWQGAKAPPADCWYHLIAQGLAKLGNPHQHTLGTFTHRQSSPVVATPTPPLSPPLPPMLWSQIEPLIEPQSPAAAVGEALHRLLQHLPTLPQNDWPTKGLAWSQAWCPPHANPQQLITQAIHILQQFPWLLHEKNLRERELQLPNGQLGRLDVLAWHQDSWWVIDYKTTEKEPILTDTYITQVHTYMHAVQAALAQQGLAIPVKGAILFTHSGTLVPVPTTPS